MSIYSPTLKCREKDSDTFDVLYNELESVIKMSNLDIAGDFNAKIGTNALESKKNTDWNIRKRKGK